MAGIPESAGTKKLLASGLLAASLLLVGTARDLRAEDEAKTRAASRGASAAATQTE